ncbi:MAG: hypothetical protein IKN72_04645 [Clostridia bacterium]|nr:hypothetical protein [Clostridia bacterium]
MDLKKAFHQINPGYDDERKGGNQQQFVQLFLQQNNAGKKNRQGEEHLRNDHRFRDYRVNG